MKKDAFTLSEVIITLVVLGIVAAITVPMLSNSASDKKWNVARQKAQATIGEAFRLMTINGEIDKSRSTEEMVTKVLPKYLKLEKTCGYVNNAEARKNCGFAHNIKTPSGAVIAETNIPATWQQSTTPAIFGAKNTSTKYTFNSSNHNTGYLFRTLDGFNVNFFYNPFCVNNSNERYNGWNGNNYYVMDRICFNAVYDMNGKRGPNQVGKDIGFVGSFINGYETVTASVLPYGQEKKFNNINTGLNYCKNLDNKNEWILPNIYELSLIYLNQKLVRNTNSGSDIIFYSLSLKPTRGIHFYNYIAYTGSYSWFDVSSCNNCYVRCVRANALK